jgi:hypothetical protein
MGGRRQGQAWCESARAVVDLAVHSWQDDDSIETAGGVGYWAWCLGRAAVRPGQHVAGPDERLVNGRPLHQVTAVLHLVGLIAEAQEAQLEALATVNRRRQNKTTLRFGPASTLPPRLPWEPLRPKAVRPNVVCSRVKPCPHATTGALDLGAPANEECGCHSIESWCPRAALAPNQIALLPQGRTRFWHAT